MDYEPLLDPENKYALAYNRYKEDVNSYFNSFGNGIDDPSNEWEIDEWIESELESLREIFTKEFNALTDKKKYFFGCSFEIYQNTYNERLSTFLNTFSDIDESVFIKQEFEKNIKYHTNEIIQKQIEYSLSLRNEFLNNKTINKYQNISNKKHQDIFCNNGFELFIYILNEHIKPKESRGRYEELSYYYRCLHNNKFIHQRPEPFRVWFNMEYEEEFTKIKTLNQVETPQRKKNFSTALDWFKTQTF